MAVYIEVHSERACIFKNRIVDSEIHQHLTLRHIHQVETQFRILACPAPPIPFQAPNILEEGGLGANVRDRHESVFHHWFWRCYRPVLLGYWVAVRSGSASAR